MPGILIIGYGNALRGDDAIGLYAAHELHRQFMDDPFVEVMACHQLTPEMADDISRSELVVFLDASCKGAPGTVESKRIPGEGAAFGFSHQLDPASLIAAAEQLYGETTTAFTITLTGASFEVGTRLSDCAQRKLPELIRRTREMVANHRKHALVCATTRDG